MKTPARTGLSIESERREDPVRGILREVAAMLRESNSEVTETADGYDFASGFGPTIVRVTELKPEGEGKAASLITIITTLPEGMREASDEALATMNKLATFSPVVRLAEGTVIAASRFSFFDPDADNFDFEIRLIYGATIFQAESVFRTLRLMEGHRDFDPLARGSEEGLWNEADFARVPSLLDGHAFALSGPDGATAEFAWEEGAVSSANGDQTALFVVEESTHPLWGRGLFFKLELPLEVSEEELPRLLTQLNALDFHQPDLTPLVGAWSPGSAGNPAFAGFVPNMFHHPMFPERLALWASFRSDWARALFEEGE